MCFKNLTETFILKAHEIFSESYIFIVLTSFCKNILFPMLYGNLYLKNAENVATKTFFEWKPV